ncbi:hypothetical protein [Roseovarius indicus]|uniref:hypothetical protein n=1 Tax=Roseovarius indicus TaxID=540747 RepID=UPI0007D9DC12|nr:hypothetical protein [Roseovarius indicus]OAO02705.1 hypothetical protein A8B76_05020 [Roseovarius indicus]
MVTVNYEARLASVQAAIEAILSGKVQSYELADGHSVTKLDLDWLTKEEDRLVARINRASRRGGAFRMAQPK